VTTVTVHPTVLSDSLAPPQIIECDAGVPRYGRAKPLRQVSAGRHKPLLTLRAHSRAARTGDSVAECGQRKACSYHRFAAVTPCLARSSTILTADNLARCAESTNCRLFRRGEKRNSRHCEDRSKTIVGSRKGRSSTSRSPIPGQRLTSPSRFERPNAASNA